MKKDIAHLNEEFSTFFIDQLVKLGVSTFCSSPGSRNTPILRAIAGQKNIESIVHFDERGSSFFGLGIAKAKKKPICISVTSGTATGHLLPAIMEAYNSYVPLIILTCDRAEELHHCGFNQTISQIGMFQKYVKWEVDMQPPSNDVPLSYLQSIASQAYLKASTFPFGPVHINFQFREPFFSEDTPHVLSQSTKVNTTTSYKHMKQDDIRSISAELNTHTRGLIITGFDAFSPEETNSLFALSKKLQFPIFPDILSGLRGQTDDSLISYHSLLSGLEEIKSSMQPTCIIYFGKQYTSKNLLYWLKSFSIEKVYHVHDSLDTQDPFYIVTDKVSLPPITFCENLLPHINSSKDDTYLNSWKNYSKVAENHIHNFLYDHKSLSEAYLFSILQKAKSFENCNMYISNSMPIRNADNFFYPEYKIDCYGTRGVSGIDGNIAVSLGIAHATKRKTIAILGDIATLHDLNSLAMISQIETPIIFFVVNNQGGSIFSFLPIYKDKNCLDKYFATSHDYNFKSICQMFKINYNIATSVQDIDSLVIQASKTTSHMFIEVKTHYEENIKTYTSILSQLKGSICEYATC